MMMMAPLRVRVAVVTAVGIVACVTPIVFFLDASMSQEDLGHVPDRLARVFSANRRGEAG